MKINEMIELIADCANVEYDTNDGGLMKCM